MSNKEYDHLLYQLARIGEVFTQETERMPVKKGVFSVSFSVQTSIQKSTIEMFQVVVVEFRKVMVMCDHYVEEDKKL